MEAYAATTGGELGIRNALANERFTASGMRLAEMWLALRERQRVADHAAATLETDRRAAIAAERAARWSMWSALISLVSTIVALSAYLLYRP